MTVAYPRRQRRQHRCTCLSALSKSQESTADTMPPYASFFFGHSVDLFFHLLYGAPHTEVIFTSRL